MDALVDYLPSPLDRPPAILLKKPSHSTTNPSATTTPTTASTEAASTSTPTTTNTNISSSGKVRGGRHKGSSSSLSLAPSVSGECCALAFKVVHDANRGYLVFIRIYSGTVTMVIVLTRTYAYTCVC